jgi:predicted amidohydrolase
MRICVYQGAATFLDVEGNLAQMERIAKAAAAQGAQLALFPELFLCGYNLGSDAARVADSVDGQSTRRAAGIARRHDIALLYGYAERAAPNLYNSAILIDNAGQTRANYRKVHLFGPDEKRIFAPGNDVVVVDLLGFRIGILICYDIEFPEFARMTVLRGANLLAVPTALTPPYWEIPTTIVRARAYENQVFVAYADHIGTERDLTYIGLSGIVGPDGRDLARAGERDVTILTTDLDPARYAASRAANTYLVDRRPALYGPVASR